MSVVREKPPLFESRIPVRKQSSFVCVISKMSSCVGFGSVLSLSRSVTMSYSETGTKSAESPICGCSVAQQVHLLSQLRVLELMGTRSLPTPGLCQPRIARTIGKLPKHHASASAKSRDVNNTGDFTATLLESALTSNPHPYGRSVSNTSSMSLLARTAGGHSLEERRQ